MARRLALILSFALLAAAPVIAGPALTPLASLTLDSQGTVQYNGQTQVVTAREPTTIRAQVEGQPQQRALIKAPDLRLDLRAHSVQAAHGVQLIVPQALLTGESLSLELAPRGFTLDKAQAVLNLAAPGAPLVLGQMRGRRITGSGVTVTVEHGMISPCTAEHPAFSLRARRLVYNEATHYLDLYGSSLEFYGLHLPLVPMWRTRLGGKAPDSGVLPAVSYSSRNGVFVPYSFNFTPGRPDLNDNLQVGLSQKRGIIFLGQAGRTEGNWDVRLWASRMEDVRTKLVGNLVYDRLPELVALGYQRGATQDQGWKLGTSLGDFYERAVLPGLTLPQVHRERALLGLGYNWGGRAQARHVGQWASVWSTGAVYSQGEHYFDTAFTVGSGRRFSPSFAADVEYIHHLQDGLSPFQFDRVDIPHELRPGLDWQMTRSWHLASSGRYDADEGRLRDYHFELNKRTRYLTWSAYYSFIGQSTGVRLDINGLTGGTAPPPLTDPLAQQYLQSQKELGEK
jgi:hypothetical protein